MRVGRVSGRRRVKGEGWAAVDGTGAWWGSENKKKQFHGLSIMFGLGVLHVYDVVYKHGAQSEEEGDLHNAAALVCPWWIPVLLQWELLFFDKKHCVGCSYRFIIRL